MNQTIKTTAIPRYNQAYRASLPRLLCSILLVTAFLFPVVTALSPWNDGVIVTYEQALAKAFDLRAITASRIHARSRPLPTFLSTLSAAAIVFFVAAHGTSQAVLLVRGMSVV